MIRIRKAENSDYHQLAELFLLTRRNTFSWENPDKFQLDDFTNATKGEIVFVAEKKDKIVGFISIWEHESPPFIHHLFVAKEFQREGVGEFMIRSLSDWLPPPYRLKCLIKNRVALSFYRKTGWIEIDQANSTEGPYYLLELCDRTSYNTGKN